MDRAVTALRRRFGPIDLMSEILPFDKTDYYDDEMGPGLKRKFVAFEKMIDRERISVVKHWTNRLEMKLSGGREKRKINLDPGYLTEANVSLATTKDFQHRVYIGRNIFLENTLRFRRGG